MSPVFPIDAKKWTKNLIDYLINDVANPALEGIDTRALPAVINAKVADEINIAAGREDLAGNAVTLFRILDEIPERDAAYWALYHVIRGTMGIAKSGIYPIDEMRHSEASQAAAMRRRRAAKTVDRRDIVRRVIATARKRGKPLTPKQLLDPVNKAIKAAGGKKISQGTLYRLLRQQRRS